MRYFAMLLVVFLQACSAGSTESDFQKFAAQSDCVTARQIYSDYQNNEVKAQLKYQNQINRVCGVVEDIELNMFDNPVVSLQVTGFGILSIGGLDPVIAANIRKGSFALFECGDINELLGDPILTNCRVVGPEISNTSNNAIPHSDLTATEASLQPYDDAPDRVCSAVVLRRSPPVNDDGTEKERCYSGLRPGDPPVCTDPAFGPSGQTVRPSQIWMKDGVKVSVCFHGDSCYPAANFRLNPSCDQEGSVGVFEL